MSLFVKPAEDKNTPTYLSTGESGACCGLSFIRHFPEPKLRVTYDDKGNPINRDAKPTIPDGAREAIKRDLEILDKSRNSLQLIVITDKQKEHYGDIIKSFGYRPLMADKYHTYAGNLLTLYGKQRYITDKKTGMLIDTCTSAKFDKNDDYDPEYPDEDIDDDE